MPLSYQTYPKNKTRHTEMHDELVWGLRERRRESPLPLTDGNCFQQRGQARPPSSEFVLEYARRSAHVGSDKLVAKFTLGLRGAQSKRGVEFRKRYFEHDAMDFNLNFFTRADRDAVVAAGIPAWRHGRKW